MKKIVIIIVFIGVLVHSGAQSIYDARIGNKEILTPIPDKTPRINGAGIYGVRPGKKFVYRIPCQGQRPIHFQVKKLPKGIQLDKENGILSGTAPQKEGTYTMLFKAENALGTDELEFKLVVGDKIALTPPTGWNTWGGHMLKVSDELIRKTADVFVEKGLADVGFQYISIDDCWMKVEPEIYNSFNEKTKNKYEGFDYTGIVGDTRDEEGNVLPNVNFPDMKGLTDYIHSKGLKAGIYSGPGETTCQKFEASKDHEQLDAAQYAAWGFDLLKYDLCSGGKDLKAMQENDSSYTQVQYWKPMVEYTQAQDRDILFNLCQYGVDDPWTWAPQLGIQSWRTGGDLNHHVEGYFDQALRLATELREYSGPGHWNDPDFLYIHKIRDHSKMANPTKEIKLSTNQRYQYVTLWSIINAPFFFSCNIEEMDEFTTRLLCNADVLKMNQDELGHVGKVVRNSNDEVIIVKDLKDGAKAVAVFNRNAQEEALIRIDWSDFGVCCEQQVYDIWRQTKVGLFKGGFTVRLSPNGVAYFIINQD